MTVVADLLSSSQYYNLPKFCSVVQWNSNGLVYPSRSNELQRPRSIFVDIKDKIYVSYDENGLVVVWNHEIPNPARIYNSTILLDDASISNFFLKLIEYFKASWKKHWNSWKSWWESKNNESFDESMIPFNISNSLFVTSNETLYIGDGQHNHIIKWENMTHFSTIELSSYSPCYGLFVDLNDTLYCSSRGNHKVIKLTYPHESKQWITAAGTGFSGATLETLNSPFGIFVTNNFNLYIADWGNNRIQLFKSDQSMTGSTIIDKDTRIDGTPLSHPTNLILDGDNNLYIVDSENHRIVFVSKDQEVYQCLIGCSKEPKLGDDYLKFPIDISFDSSGYILVSDTNNDRVMKFRHHSSLCEPTTTTTVTITTSTATTDSISNKNNILTTKSEDNSSPLLTSNEPRILQTVTSTSRTSDSKQSISTTTQSIKNTLLPAAYFVPDNCPDSNFIGSQCDTPANPCDLLNPCADRDSCINDPTQTGGYICKIKTVNPCINSGTCIQLNETNFRCNCVEHRTGTHCELWIDYCHNITCLNNGQCRSIPPSYVCVCISSSFSGRHCENVANSILIRRYVSSTFGYIGIIALCSVAAFIIIMDILKYGFGIDPVRSEHELIQQRRNQIQSKKSNIKHTLVQKF